MAGGRWRWLGASWFLLAVVVLAANDHILKARFPGWWTGKLSDVAGVVVVATAAAVAVGPRRGALLTVAAFVALKTVPGVAEAASPVLGGVTRRDPTDLLALVVLLPLAVVLRPRTPLPSGAPSTGPRDPSRAPTDRAAPRSRRRGAAAVLPLLGSVAAVLTATATSCSPAPAVTQIVVRDRAVHALYEQGFAAESFARSDDGGRTWVESEPPEGWVPLESPARTRDPVPLGPSEACLTDGTCLRVRDQRRIERVAPDGAVREELALTEDELDEISTGCLGGQRGVLTSIAVVEQGSGTTAVASFGADGAVVRDADGRWEQVRVRSAPPGDPSRVEEVLGGLGLAVAGIGAALAVCLVNRRRWPSWRAGIAAAAGWWVAGMAVVGLATSVAGSATPGPTVTSRLIPILVVVCVGIAVVVGRRPRPDPTGPPHPQLPPPPDGVAAPPSDGRRPGPT